MQSEIMLGDFNTNLKLDPRTKILLAIMVSIVLVSGGVTGIEMVFRVMLAIIPAILLLSEKKFKVGLSYLALFLLAAFCENVILSKTSGALNLIILIMSGLVSRFLPGIITGYYLVTTTTVSEFNAAMERMYVTEKITIPLSVMFRFIPTISEEMSAINDAMKMRGIEKSNFFKNPILFLEYRLVPLMISIVKIGEELSAASLTKGLGSCTKRTNICEIGFHFTDIILSFVAIAGFITCTLI